MAKSEAKNLKKGGGTLQHQILAMMAEKADPKELWTREDVVAEMGLENRQVENALYNAWLTEKFYRHKDKTEDGLFQFALEMKPSDREIYSATPRSTLMSPGPKRRGSMPTAKEIRMDFLEIQRLMARLEDKVMTVAERSEEMDKQLNKLKNIL